MEGRPTKEPERRCQRRRKWLRRWGSWWEPGAIRSCLGTNLRTRSEEKKKLTPKKQRRRWKRRDEKGGKKQWGRPARTISWACMTRGRIVRTPSRATLRAWRGRLRAEPEDGGPGGGAHSGRRCLRRGRSYRFAFFFSSCFLCSAAFANLYSFIAYTLARSPLFYHGKAGSEASKKEERVACGTAAL